MQELETKKQIVIIMNDFLKVLQKKKRCKDDEYEQRLLFLFYRGFSGVRTQKHATRHNQRTSHERWLLIVLKMAISQNNANSLRLRIQVNKYHINDRSEITVRSSLTKKKERKEITVRSSRIRNLILRCHQLRNNAHDKPER